MFLGETQRHTFDVENIRQKRMKPLPISTGSERDGRSAQSKYLGALMLYEHLSAREIARRSTITAERNRRPELAFGHQSVSAWANGTRCPNRSHRGVLAAILGVTLANLNRACDAESENPNLCCIGNTATAIVRGALHNYAYPVALRTDINLGQPAVYQDWREMFTFSPVDLMRHFRKVRYQLFGWIPDDSASPMVRAPRCLVPLERVSQRSALQMLDTAESAQRRVWFLYLPGGKLHTGIGYRDGGWFLFARTNARKVAVEHFPLSEVAFVGYFAGNILFHLLNARRNQRVSTPRDHSTHTTILASLGNPATARTAPAAISL